MIIVMVFAQELPSHFAEWSKLKNCYYGMCEPIDHLTEDEIEEQRDWVCGGGWRDSDNDLSASEVEEEVRELIAERMSDFWLERCWERRDNWQQRVTMANIDKKCSRACTNFSSFDEVCIPGSDLLINEG